MPGSQVSTRSSRSSASRRAVGDDDHPGMNRVADADAAAVMHRHPGGAGGGVQQRVQNRPVGDGVAAVAHAFGLAVRRGDRSGVEMIAADHDRRRDRALAHQLVDAQAEARAIAVAEPEDARRQSLERARARCASRIQRQSGSSSANISSAASSVTRMSSGSPDSAAHRNGPLPSQKSGRMYSGTKPGISKRVGHAGLHGLRADVVAVVERDRAARLQREHRRDVPAHRGDRAPLVFGRDRRCAAQPAAASDRPSGT